MKSLLPGAITALFFFTQSPTLSSALPNMPRDYGDASQCDESPARVLMGHAGGIIVADYQDSNFNVSLNESVIGNPSWMAFASPNKLYAVDEWSQSLRLFDLDLESNKVELKAEQNGSAGVVHLEFNKDKTRLVGAAYGNGTIDVWKLEKEGLSKIKTIASPGPLGPDKDRQDAPHPHQAVLDPSGRYFFVNDLGTDSVLVIDSKDDLFEIVTRANVTPGGSGPRHGVFLPQGGVGKAKKATHYLVACEMANNVHIFSLDYSDKGIALTEINKVSTFGPDSQPKDIKAAALGEIVLAPNNEDLYISNRLTGHDTDNIVHFKITKPKCGTSSIDLKYMSTVSASGKVPRMISLSKDGKALFVGNPSGELGAVALKRNEDGSLEEKPLAGIKNDKFATNGADNGPAFILQI